MGDEVLPHMMTDEDLEHYRDDGTAINWDTERIRTPLDFDGTDWVALGCGVFFLALAAVGVIGAFRGWWPA